MPSTRPVLHSLVVRVTSDTICPFCFIGLKKLEQALQRSAYLNLHSATRIFEPAVHFVPYQLDPDLPTDHAVDKRAYFAERFGPEKVDAMEATLQTRGQEVGINFSYDGEIRSTVLSHRLLEYAYTQGGWPLQHALLTRLFQWYFEQEGDPGSPSALAKLAVEVGVFPSAIEAQAFIESDQFLDKVQEGIQRANKAGIRGVPHFEIVAHPAHQDSAPLKAEMQGALDVSTFVAMFDELGKRAQAWKR